MSDEVPPEEQPGPSTVVLTRTTGAIPSTETPKKGILKRPSWNTPSDVKPSLIPVPGFRASPDRLPDKQTSKIPKLSVTWWEKNAVAIFGDTSDENNTDSEQILKDLGSGQKRATIRQTAILDSEEDSEGPFVMQPTEEVVEEEDDPRDDVMSITSSTGSTASSIVGRWWTGKDMRFVPHCQKRGCNHQHHGNGELGEYLTPTQRRSKEMNTLKKELRSALGERDEKDKHLSELRERIKEIEMMNDVQNALADSHKMMQRERETREQYEKEKKQTEKKHNIRVNQLVQETLHARDEITKLNARIAELEGILGRPRTEMGTMTDSVQYALPSTSVPPPQSPTDPTDPSCLPQQPKSPPVSPFEINPLSPARSVDQGSTMAAFAIPSPLSISVESKISGQPMYLSQEALNHIQAYQNEAFVWRTKAAQLEMVVKDQLMKSSQTEQQLRRELDCAMAELDPYRRGMKLPVVPLLTEQTSTENGSVLPSSTSLPALSLEKPMSECSDGACIERKKCLIEENKQLLLNIEDANTRIQELEEDVGILRNEVEAMEADRKHMRSRLDQAAKDVEEKSAEITASGITVGRLQNEKETLQKAIAYMEERMQVYQNTLMEHDLVVSDETAGNWRKGFSDPRYSVMVSKRVQTDLSSQDLSEHENEFESTKRRLEDLHSEFAANRSDLKGRFEEIEHILLTKTQLVEMLTKQLEDIRRDQRAQLDEHQREREEYKRSLEELGAVAEKVPLLETRIEELLKEIGEMEMRLKGQKEEYEAGLEDALEEALHKYKEQGDYWKEKVVALETQLEKAKAETEQLTREKAELNLRARLEKVDLENRLTSSIDHVAQLNNQIQKSRRDVECEARPRHVSKYVACRPNAKSKSTTIEKGDLFDESEERLKLCQGELATTRRQVHVLQQKLISTMQEKMDKPLQVRRRIACVVEKQAPSKGEEKDEGKIETLQEKNEELREKLSRVEDEKVELMEQEKERIQHIAQEFDNVRQELDQEMCRYESEKKWLKSRISNLEKDNKELQRQVDEKSDSPSKDRKLPTITVHDEDKMSMRKTLSEPELGYEDEEISQLKSENDRLQRELDRVRESLKRTASAASAASRRSNRSQLSPAFGHLADDLNMVKSDLEQILCQMDEEAPPRPRSPSARRTPAEEEQLQSQILDKVMLDWEADEREALAKDLQRSRQERDSLKMRTERLTTDLNRAMAELEVFRSERRQDDGGAGDGRLKKSRSTVDLVDRSGGDAEETARWKLKCGTMFRELNTMRSGYTKAMEERRELKIQLAMLRGELEIAKCQPGPTHRGSMSSSAYFSPKSIRSTSTGGYQTADEKQPNGDVIVHESPLAFRRGSTKEAVECTVIASTSMRNLAEEEKPEDRRARRAQSAKSRQRRRASSKEDYVAMERRRSERKKSCSVYATAPHSLSSSMTSLHNPAETEVIASKPPPCMSQSWHEPSTSTGVDPMKQREEEEQNRSNGRMMSLRETVGRLTRDNTILSSEVEKQKKRAIDLEQRLGYLSGVEGERLNRLEQEKETLREQVEMLLRKVEQEREANVRDNRLEEQLTLSRQEVEMYERKLREMEEERREMYLVMFKKGQQAATMDLSQKKELDQMTQDRVVLKFLHDAFYYFLLNKGDSKEHLQAIMTMLDFSAEQKEDVLRKRGKSH